MITVKLYGLLRVDSGIKERQLEAATLTEVYAQLRAMGFSKGDLAGCVALVNGKQPERKQKLCDGDVVQLLPPVAGG